MYIKNTINIQFHTRY